MLSFMFFYFILKFLKNHLFAYFGGISNRILKRDRGSMSHSDAWSVIKAVCLVHETQAELACGSCFSVSKHSEYYKPHKLVGVCAVK